MSDPNDLKYTNVQLANTPGKAERVEVVGLELDLSSIELDLSDINVDLTSIEGLIGETNVKLDEIKTAVDGIELDVDLSEIETTTGEIKAELEAANVTLGEIKSGIDGLEINVDLEQLETTSGEIKSEIETANVTLGEIKTAIEAIEIDVDFDLSALEQTATDIKGESQVANATLDRIESEIVEGVKTLNKSIEEITRGTIKLYTLGAEIGAAYTSDPLVSLNTENNGLFSIKIKNTGANPLDFEIRSKASWAATLETVFASQVAVAPGQSAEFPIASTAFDGRYNVYIRAASATTAVVETIVKTGPKSQLPFQCDWTVGNGGDFATIQAALACITVKDGDRLLLLKGEYNLTSTLTINRRISIVGESRKGSVLKNDPTWTDGGSLISVTADGVSFEHLTISQASTNANAFAVFVQKSGEQKVNGFSFIKVDLEYSKAGVTYRANNSIVYDCYFELIPSGTGNRRPVFLMGNGGNSFVDSCVFDHPSNLVVVGTNNRLIHMTGLGSAGADGTYTGSMTISQNKSIGFVAQFVNHDVLTGTANGFSLIVHSNTVSETNAFVVAVGSNFELYQQAIFYNNKLTNQHVLGAAPGKGMFFFDGSAIRLTPMPFFAANNELQNLTLRASETDAPDSPAGQSLATIRTTAADAYITAGRNPVVFSSRIPRRLPQLDLKFWS
jgi:uncharacterized protein YukE